MSDDIKDCDLCGLAVEVDGFELKTVEIAEKVAPTATFTQGFEEDVKLQ